MRKRLFIKSSKNGCGSDWPSLMLLSQETYAGKYLKYSPISQKRNEGAAGIFRWQLGYSQYTKTIPLRIFFRLSGGVGSETGSRAHPGRTLFTGSWNSSERIALEQWGCLAGQLRLQVHRRPDNALRRGSLPGQPPAGSRFVEFGSDSGRGHALRYTGTAGQVCCGCRHFSLCCYWGRLRVVRAEFFPDRWRA